MWSVRARSDLQAVPEDVADAKQGDFPIEELKRQQGKAGKWQALALKPAVQLKLEKDYPGVIEDEDYQLLMKFIDLLPTKSEMQGKFGHSHYLVRFNEFGPYSEAVLPLK